MEYHESRNDDGKYGSDVSENEENEYNLVKRFCKIAIVCFVLFCFYLFTD